MVINQTIRDKEGYKQTRKQLYGLYMMGMFLTFLQGLVLFRMGRHETQVTGPASGSPRLFSFTETQILSMAPGPVTRVRAFLAVDTSVFPQPTTIGIKPFPCTFVTALLQRDRPDVLALVLSKDCFLTSRGVIVSEQRIFCQSWRCDKPGHRSFGGLHFKGNFSSILYQFTVHSTNWAHWICETLAVLVWLPSEVSTQAIIVWTNFTWRPGGYIRDSLILFGFTKNLCLPDGCFLFTQELWTLAGFRFNQPYPGIIREFRCAFVEHLGLPQVIPFKYFLMQRVRSRTRFLENIGAITQAFQMAFPSLPWILITYFPSVEKSAREFWDANLLFAVHGAGCGSLVFMQKNTTFLEVASQSCIKYMWQLTQICGIYHILYVLRGVTHFETRHINLNLSIVGVMISLLKGRIVSS
jgi:hypothetical protein